MPNDPTVQDDCEFELIHHLRKYNSRKSPTVKHKQTVLILAVIVKSRYFLLEHLFRIEIRILINSNNNEYNGEKQSFK